MRRLPFALVALALGLAAGGGDDGGGERTSADDAWTSQVNTICRRNKTEVQKVTQGIATSGVSDPKEAAAQVLEKSAPVEKELIGDLRDVDVPDNRRSAYDDFLDRIEDTIPLFEDLAGVLRSGQEDPDLTKKLKDIAADTRPFATKYKLTDCLTDGGAS